MLLNYIFLGDPDLPLIQRVLTLLQRQANPSLKHGCDHPRGLFWTLNIHSRTKALNLLRTLQTDEHPTLHVEIADATMMLSNATKAPLGSYNDEATEMEARRSELEKQTYGVATQMLSDYFNLLNLSSRPTAPLAERVTRREWVTAKELLTFWIAYTFGGVIMDAGCSASQPTWGFPNPPTHAFLVPIAGRDTVGYLASPRTQGQELQEGGRTRFYNDRVFEFLQAKNMIGRTARQIYTLDIDNWLCVAHPLSLIALYALRMHLLTLLWAYDFLQENHDQDALLANGAGQFALVSGAISENAIYQGFYEYFVLHSKAQLVQEKGKLYLDIRDQRLKVSRKAGDAKNQRRLSEGIIKNGTIPQTNAAGIIINGWRAKLTFEESLAAVFRSKRLKSKWNEYWDPLMEFV